MIDARSIGGSLGDGLFQMVLEAAPVGMMMVNSTGHIVLVNAQIENLFGHPRAALIGQTLEVLVPERFRGRHPAFREAFLTAPRARPMGAGRDLFGLRADGSEVPIEIGLNPLQTPEGSFVLSSVVDISERKRAEEERERLLVEMRKLNRALEDRGQALRGTLRERETMLQEIHHRVKNNLQIISSLINMQANQLDAGAGRDALDDCQSRVQAMALIHEQLYQSADYSRVSLSPYIAELARNIVRAAEGADGRIALHIEADGVALPVDQAIPCGLIVNELITNALKHAFPSGREGAVRVSLAHADGGRVALRVSDDGVGVAPSLDLRATGSLGLRLVFALTEQLGGAAVVRRDAGTAFEITFPKEV